MERLKCVSREHLLDIITDEYQEAFNNGRSTRNWVCVCVQRLDFINLQDYTRTRNGDCYRAHCAHTN